MKRLILALILALLPSAAWADNILVTEGVDKTVAFDDISSANYQRIKLIYGSDGSNSGDVATANPLPIQLRTSGGTETGTVGNPLQCTVSNNETQYTEGSTDASITGNAIMWEDTGDALRPVSASKPLPIDITDTSLPVTGTFWQTTQPVSGTVSVVAETAASNYSFLSNAAVLSAQIKGSPGQVYDIECFNRGADEVFMRIYDQTGAPIAGDTSNIEWRGFIPGNTSAAGYVVPFPKGRDFSVGIGIRVTGDASDSDATALVADEVACNVGFK